jgi:hypothetical protein
MLLALRTFQTDFDPSGLVIYGGQQDSNRIVRKCMAICRLAGCATAGATG